MLHTGCERGDAITPCVVGGRFLSLNATQRLALATCVLTFVLIVVGVIVRATGSGLGCPDWPLCHGGAVPPAQHHALIEFSHRFTASIVGFMVIGLAIMVWRNYRHVTPIKWAALLLVPLVGIQGLLGAITVVRELPPEIVATHLITAMIVMAFELFIFFGLNKVEALERGEKPAPAYPRASKFLAFSLVYLVFVMWVGAYMTESGGATACADWPTCNGMNFLPGNDEHEMVHMGHRYLAGGFLIVLAVTMAAVRRSTNERWTKPFVVFLGPLYILQVVVGAINVWLTFPESLTVSHTAIATAIWIVLASTLILCSYRPAVPRRADVRKRAEVPA